MSKHQLTETDNSNLELKLELRRRLLAKYHAEPPNVFDCCQGTGKIWKAFVVRRLHS